MKASTIFPDLDQYRGLPLDYGRMEPTVSDPSVTAQMGMRVGHPERRTAERARNAQHPRRAIGHVQGRVRCASVDRTAARRRAGRVRGVPPAARCAGARRRARRAVRPQSRPGRAADVLRRHGRSRIRSTRRTCGRRRTTTSNFAMDVAAVRRHRRRAAAREGRDHLREVGRARVQRRPGQSRRAGREPDEPGAGRTGDERVGGPACNPYDTERVPRGSSSGSGVAVSANLVTIGICEQTGASCQGPASRNGIATLLTTKGVTARQRRHRQPVVHRSRRHPRAHARRCGEGARRASRTRRPATTTRAIRSPRCPRRSCPTSRTPVSRSTTTRSRGTPKPLQGMRIAHPARAHGQAHAEPRGHLRPDRPRDQDGAARPARRRARRDHHTRLSGRSRRAEPDATRFADALSELLPRLMPEIFTRRDSQGRAGVRRAGLRRDVVRLPAEVEQAPGAAHRRGSTSPTSQTFGARALLPVRRCVHRLHVRHRSLPRRPRRRENHELGRLGRRTPSSATMRRGPGAENWVALRRITGAEARADRLARSYIARLALLRVMSENRIDVFVHPENTVPTPKIRARTSATNSLDGITPFFQIPRIVVPAGMTDVVYEPRYALNADEDGLHLGPRAGHAEDDAAASDADRDDVLRRPGRRADADQGRHGLRGGDAPSHAAAGVRAGAATRVHWSSLSEMASYFGVSFSSFPVGRPSGRTPRRPGRHARRECVHSRPRAAPLR